MVTISQLIAELKKVCPSVKFMNGCISKSEKCCGVYARGNSPPVYAIGTQSSYNLLPVTLLVHWGENSNDCEIQSNSIYQAIAGITTINNKRVIQIQMNDSCPVNIGRDDKNICEMTIRMTVIYER